MPDFSIEHSIPGRVAGCDEVGRGPLAGPVVAACVYIPDNIRTMNFIADIKDSKKLSVKKRDILFGHITQHCHHAHAIIDVETIDSINILQASLLAMAQSIQSINPDHVLVDGNKLPRDIPCPAQAIIQGDNVSTSIAAASIIAKVTRDRIMQDYHTDYPHYAWNKNAGYGSKAHMDAIETYGITPHHRKSFAPIARKINQ